MTREEALAQLKDAEFFGQSDATMDALRVAAHALRAFGPMLEALEAVDGEVPASEGYLRNAEEVSIPAAALLKVETVLTEIRVGALASKETGVTTETPPVTDAALADAARRVLRCIDAIRQDLGTQFPALAEATLLLRGALAEHKETI